MTVRPEVTHPVHFLLVPNRVPTQGASHGPTAHLTMVNGGRIGRTGMVRPSLSSRFAPLPFKFQWHIAPLPFHSCAAGGRERGSETDTKYLTKADTNADKKKKKKKDRVRETESGQREREQEFIQP